MKRKELVFWTIFGVLVQFIFMLAGWNKGSMGFFPDNLIFIAFALIAFFGYKKLNFNYPTILGINAYMIIHGLGVFDFYNLNILGIPYDKIVHFSGFFLLTGIFALWHEDEMRDKAWKTGAFIFLAALGIGATIEVAEYTGFLILGEGDGFFFFGAGDGSDWKFNGSWENAMTDLVANMVGSLAALFTVCTPRSRRLDLHIPD